MSKQQYQASKTGVKFSIITPSFRQLACLKLCVRSVGDQDVEKEHIIQDAGTGEDLERWVKQSSSAQIFVEKDDGMYDAINRGLARARGEICAWLNCDEQYLPGILARVEKFFTRHPETDVVFGDAVLIDGYGSLLSYRRAIMPMRAHVRYVHLNTLSCATFFRRRIFEEGHRFDPNWKAIGDAVWMDDLLKAKKRMAIIQEPLAAFTFTGQNLSASHIAQSEAQRWRGDHWQNRIGPLLTVLHRLRKWRAGAYQKRQLTVAIYTPDSLDQRKEVRSSEVGYGWPKTDSPYTN